MKYKIIMLPNPILVSDEQIEKEDWVYDTTNDWEEGGKLIEKATHDSFLNPKSGYKKIIAGVKDLPQIDFSALSEEDCKKIGWVDVEKLALLRYPVKMFHVSSSGPKGTTDLSYDRNVGARTSFIEGFKTAQSLNKKKFSLEEIEKAWEHGIDEGRWKKGDPLHLSFSEFIESLSRSKMFEVEVEMKPKSNLDLPCPNPSDGDDAWWVGMFENWESAHRHWESLRALTTDESIKILKIL